jgi:hypothetical protein
LLAEQDPALGHRQLRQLLDERASEQ